MKSARFFVLFVLKGEKKFCFEETTEILNNLMNTSTQFGEGKYAFAEMSRKLSKHKLPNRAVFCNSKLNLSENEFRQF